MAIIAILKSLMGAFQILGVSLDVQSSTSHADRASRCKPHGAC